MIYSCEIKTIDEEEVTIEIGGVEIVCFCNAGIDDNEVDRNVKCELLLYDEQEITEAKTEEIVGFYRINKSYAYKIVGVLDFDRRILESIIKISLDELDIEDYGYLDGRKVSVIVSRIDVDFM